MDSVNSWKRQATRPLGIICGASKDQEWLLPTWWERYTAFHSYPVTFCDFGMSQESLAFCRKRGEVISIELDPLLIATKEELPLRWVAHAHSVYGPRVFDFRLQWFKKPFALLSSCYKKALWLDLDCEILQSIEPLLSQDLAEDALGLVRDYHHPALFADIKYNGGVILFHHGNRLLQKWAEQSLEKNHLFIGDDQLLSYLIAQGEGKVLPLEEIYNWKPSRGVNPSAVIMHWVGDAGKAYLRKWGGIKPAFHKSVGEPFSSTP
ncbi:MAG: hypothetical protein RLZZ453_648 [Chlamydiota bacterium]|jgi:hypothetical protein